MRDAEGRLIGAVILLEDVTEMREVDRLKTEFISVASAKFRAPLQDLQLALHTFDRRLHRRVDRKSRKIYFSLPAKMPSNWTKSWIDLLELAEIESGARRAITRTFTAR